MKLDRNTSADHRGKYALLKLRPLAEVNAKLSHGEQVTVRDALQILSNLGVLEYGTEGTSGEFFAIMLKDKYAGGALHTYASYAVRDGEIEYGQDVMALAKRSGEFSPFCKKPD